MSKDSPGSSHNPAYLLGAPRFAHMRSDVARRLVSHLAGHASDMLILGLILLIIGFVLAIPILWTIGLILAIIGAVFWILGGLNHPVAGRRHYW